MPQPEPLSSLARRERAKAAEPKKPLELVVVPRAEPVPVAKAAEPVVVQIPPRARITFIKVVRHEVTDEVIGLEPIYEE